MKKCGSVKALKPDVPVTKGRVRALKALRDERSERLNRQGNAKMAVSDTERSGKLVFDVQDLNFNLPDKNLVKTLIPQ